MVAEDASVAQQDRRTVMTKANLTNLNDPSGLAEAPTSWEGARWMVRNCTLSTSC